MSLENCTTDWYLTIHSWRRMPYVFIVWYCFVLECVFLQQKSVGHVENKKSLLILPMSNIFSHVEVVETSVATYRKSEHMSETPCRTENIYMSARIAWCRGKAGRPSGPSEEQTHSQLSTEQLGKLEAILVPHLCSLPLQLSV